MKYKIVEIEIKKPKSKEGTRSEVSQLRRYIETGFGLIFLPIQMGVIEQVNQDMVASKKVIGEIELTLPHTNFNYTGQGGIDE